MTAPTRGCSTAHASAEDRLLVADLDVAQGEEADELPDCHSSRGEGPPTRRGRFSIHSSSIKPACITLALVPFRANDTLRS